MTCSSLCMMPRMTTSFWLTVMTPEPSAPGVADVVKDPLRIRSLPWYCGGFGCRAASTRPCSSAKTVAICPGSPFCSLYVRLLSFVAFDIHNAGDVELDTPTRHD